MNEPSTVPPGLSKKAQTIIPALKRWAIFGRPFGTHVAVGRQSNERRQQDADNGKAQATYLQAGARKNGLKLMREDGWSKVLAGMTTVEEIVRVTKTDASAVA